jgi:hypothetical protein
MTFRRRPKPTLVTLPDGRSVTAEGVLQAAAAGPAADTLLRVLEDPAAEPRCTCADCGCHLR